MEPGDLISNKYRLQRLLGSGGMGSVWAACNELTEREFAIKFLLASLSKNKDALHRFFQEARACGRIKHPAVVAVYDVGEADDGSPFLVMELLEGEGLDQKIDREGKLAPALAAQWLAFVARGLEEAHARGVVHRDLKPGNIFLSVDARGEIVPKILDFGVSKATGPRSDSFAKTMTGAVLGSPAYMSPEQARGETEVDLRSDIWALGVMLYETLTGRIPFDAPNYNALMMEILSKPHRPVTELAPDVPHELEAVVEGAMAKDKARRIATAREFAERLEAALASMGVVLPVASPIVIPSPTASSPGAAKPLKITQGNWSDTTTTVVVRGRRSRAGVVALSAFISLVVIASGAALVFRLQLLPFKVASAARPSMPLVMPRINKKIAQFNAQHEAEQKEVQQQQEAQLISEQPPIIDLDEVQSPSSSATPSVAPRSPVAPRKDPHGGVHFPGF